MLDLPRDRFREASEADVEDLAPRLRAADVEELYDFLALRPQAALLGLIRRSHVAITALDEISGRPEAMFGLSLNLTATAGYPWFTATSVAMHRRKRFAEARDFITLFHGVCPFLEGWVGAENHRAIGFIRQLGFTLCDPAPAGVFGRPFRRFSRLHYPKGAC